MDDPVRASPEKAGERLARAHDFSLHRLTIVMAVRRRISWRRFLNIMIAENATSSRPSKNPTRSTTSFILWKQETVKRMELLVAQSHSGQPACSGSWRTLRTVRSSSAVGSVTRSRRLFSEACSAPRAEIADEIVANMRSVIHA